MTEAVYADDAAAAAGAAAVCFAADAGSETCRLAAPKVRYSATSLITISDLAQIEKAQVVAGEAGVPTYRFNSGTHYYTADPAAAAKAAREQAIAKARKDADDYAASLGYHVVRMTRVSNASPSLGMRDLHSIVGYANTAPSRLNPSYFGSATYATVGIDFVIVPN